MNICNGSRNIHFANRFTARIVICIRNCLQYFTHHRAFSINSLWVPSDGGIDDDKQVDLPTRYSSNGDTALPYVLSKDLHSQAQKFLFNKI